MDLYDSAIRSCLLQELFIKLRNQVNNHHNYQRLLPYKLQPVLKLSHRNYRIKIILEITIYIPNQLLFFLVKTLRRRHKDPQQVIQRCRALGRSVIYTRLTPHRLNIAFKAILILKLYLFAFELISPAIFIQECQKLSALLKLNQNGQSL